MNSSAWIEVLRRNGGMRMKLAVEGLFQTYEIQWSKPILLTIPWREVLIAAIAVDDGVRIHAIKAHFQKISNHSTSNSTALEMRALPRRFQMLDLQ